MYFSTTLMGIVLLAYVPATVTAQQNLTDLLDREPNGQARPTASDATARPDAGDAGKFHPPAASSRNAAIATVHDIFRTDFAAANTAEKRLGFAQVLIKHASEASDPVDKWALLSEAARLAAAAGSTSVTFNTIDEMAASFDINADEYRLQATENLVVKVTPSEAMILGGNLVSLCRKLIAAENLVDAEKALGYVKTLSKKSRNADLVLEFNELNRRIRDLEATTKRRQAVLQKLAQQPDSPEINFEAGTFYCFQSGDWSTGIPYLAKGSDAAIAAAARSEIAAANKPNQAVAVADSWWLLTETNKDPAITEAVRAHAAEIYRRALGGLTGLEKVRVEKRLAEAASVASKGEAGKWLVIFRGSDPAAWDTAADGRTPGVLVAVPLATVPESMRYVRVRNSIGDQVILQLTKTQLGSEFVGERYGWQGTKRAYWGGTQLGIFDVNSDVSNQRGEVCVYGDEANKALRTGWGFGTSVHNAETAVCWQGRPAQTAALEISVKTGNLAAQERRQLLE